MVFYQSCVTIIAYPWWTLSVMNMVCHEREPTKANTALGSWVCPKSTSPSRKYWKNHKLNFSVLAWIGSLIFKLFLINWPGYRQQESVLAWNRNWLLAAICFCFDQWFFTFFTTPPLSNCPFFRPPWLWISCINKCSLFIGKFNYKTFHAVGRVRSRDSGNFPARPPVKNHWFRLCYSLQ